MAGSGSVLYAPPVPPSSFSSSFSSASSSSSSASSSSSSSSMSALLGRPFALARHAQYVPYATNNEAEYLGAILGLQLALHLGARRVRAEGDSALVVNHFSGAWRCKQPHLQPLLAELRALERRLDSCVLAHIPRAGNAEADAEANSAMDARASATRGELDAVERAAAFVPRLLPLQYCAVAANGRSYARR